MGRAAALERFIEAQQGVYAQALRELRAGNKQSHWMWFIFPQLAVLGRSATARFYGISDLAEARDYLADAVLGPRLAECTEAVLGWAGRRSAEEILGPVDATKFRSSMTLFEAAGGDPRHSQALAAFCNDERDALTLAKLGLA